MGLTTIIIIAVLSGLFLIAILVAISIATKMVREQKHRKHIEQITNESYFVNEKHDKEHWYVSYSGELENEWSKGMDYDYPIEAFGYYENFSYSFVNSKFIRTKSFLMQFMNNKSLNLTIKRLKINATCLENIWWKKYKVLLKTAYNDIIQLSDSPEYFFFKYYLKFVSGLREILIHNLVTYVIPNTIFLEMNSLDFKHFNISKVSDPQKNILLAFKNVKIEADKLAVALNKMFTEELKEKGPNFKIDYKDVQSDTVEYLNPSAYIEKVYWRDKMKETSKKNKIKKNDDVNKLLLDLDEKAHKQQLDLEKQRQELKALKRLAEEQS